MTTILHIGPTYTPHVHDVVEQIDQNTDFKNVLISCQKKQLFPGYFPDHIPIYFYNYLDQIETQGMKDVVARVIQQENPDLVIGHSFSESAGILNYVLETTRLPAITFIWGRHDCVKSSKRKLMYNRNINVLRKINYIACTNEWLNVQATHAYGITLNDFVEACPPVNLAQYTDHIPDVSRPRLFLAKPRGDKFILGCLPHMMKKYPKLTVSVIRTPYNTTTLKRLGIANKVRFYAFPQTQHAFANIIKQSNIIHTITGDPGTGATALQASYAGCINIMRKCESSAGMLDEGTNVVMSRPNVKHVKRALNYSIKNLKKLCYKFKENNKHLLRYDRERTWKHLYAAIQECLSNTKTKISPTGVPYVI